MVTNKRKSNWLSRFFVNRRTKHPGQEDTVDTLVEIVDARRSYFASITQITRSSIGYLPFRVFRGVNLAAAINISTMDFSRNYFSVPISLARLVKPA